MSAAARGWVRWGRWVLGALVALAILVGQMRGAAGAVGFGNSANFVTGAAASTLTWSHTVGSNANRLLLVRVSNDDSSITVNNVTYGGVALTPLVSATSGSGGSDVRGSAWYLVAPPSGTANVVVTLSSATEAVAVSNDLFGVSQYTPFGTPVTTVGDSTSASVTVAAAVGDLVVDGLTTEGRAGASATAGAGQSGVSYRTGAGSVDVLGAGSVKAGAASTTTSWSWSTQTKYVLTSVAVKQSFGISGNVFEDLNYGGGAGRSKADATGNVSRPNARVELATVSGGNATVVAATTTDASGNYSFSGAGSGTYIVRVVSGTVRSSRVGNIAGLLPISTYHADSTGGAAIGVTNEVGGRSPAVTSSANVSANIGEVSTTAVSTAEALADVTVTSAAVTAIDFGYNFNTVTNTNDTGQGSLRQVITNANTLTDQGTLQQSGRTAGVENVIFMISNGSNAAGLRSSNNYFSGGVATITPTSSMTALSTPMVVDARTQPGWSNRPIVRLVGSSAGSAYGLTLRGSATAAGFIVSNFSADGVYFDGGNNKLMGSWVGLSADGTTAAGNNGLGVYVVSGSGDTIGGTGTNDGNVLSGNSSSGIGVYGTNTLIQGNVIGLNAQGNGKIPNGGDGISVINTTGVTIGGSASGARNVIGGQDTAQFSDGIWLDRGSGHTIRGNYIGVAADGTTAFPNRHSGMNVMGSSNNVIGGTAAGEANIFASNSGAGVYVSRWTDGSGNAVAASGNRISGNSFFNNVALGIDINEDGVTANDNAKPTTSGNNGMDFPVFTAATLSGTNLTVSGYVGNTTGQTLFGSAVVEVFIADVTTAGNGEGKTYLGALTANASGVFSGTLSGVTGITGGTSRITATARDASNNTSEFGANVVVTSVSSISGTVFEDVNYGGGAGRNRTTAFAAGGVGRPNVRVELFSVSGTTATQVAATTTDAAGAYTFTNRTSGNYMLRVVSSTVTSSRNATATALIPVLTYHANYTGGAAVDVTDEVGGRGPSVTNLYNVSSNTNDSSSTNVSYAEGIATVTLGNANAAGLDFGYNFNTVTNVNASSQGSLRQAILNVNTMTGDGSLLQAGRTPGIEHVIFMISNGTTGSGGSLGLTGGLRTVNNFFSAGVATIAPTAALPIISSPLVVDAQAQPGWSNRPIIELNGTSASATSDGLAISAAGSTVRGFVINRFKRHGLNITGANSTVQGCWIGLDNGGSAKSANNGSGIYTAGSGHTIGGTGSNQGNVISGNAQYGVALSADAGTTGNSTVQGNTIGPNPAGNGAQGNTLNGIYVLTTGNTIGGAVSGAGNLISGNGANGLQMDAGNNIVQGNRIGLNGAGNGSMANANSGIYLGGGTGNTIGGTTALHRNVIGGNQGGIFLNAGGGHTIQGNYIGMNVDGTASISNTLYFGMELYGSGANQVGGTATGAGNLISGQSGAGKGGIYVASNNNIIQGNRIGTNADGSLGVANNGPGIAVTVASITGNTIGGTASGAGNTIAFNAQQGVVVSGANATANNISRNSIYGNTGIGIDIAGAGRTANNSTRNTSLGNADMDTPVFTNVTLTSGTLTVVGYVGTAAGQTTFASARIEVFKALNDGTGFGQGQTYLGTVTADGSGNFNGSFSVTGLVSGDLITATAADASGNTSEFSSNFTVASQGISGTVFEDRNYGGGAGRTLAASGGLGVANARVELYDANGTYVNATTTNSSGVYSFTGLTNNTTYFVRVVNSSVLSRRVGTSAALVPVMTYRTEAGFPASAPSAVSDEVGGTRPAAVDAASGTTGTTLWTQCGTEGQNCSFTGTRIVRYGGTGNGNSGFATRVLTGGTSCINGVFGDPITGTSKACFLLNADYQSISTVRVASSGVNNIDFGFNFSSVVNTNDSGQGSLRQAITNANALDNAGLQQTGRTAGVEHLVFMISNGTTGSGGSLGLTGGLRSGLNYFTTSVSAGGSSYGVATIAAASGLPQINSRLVLDAQTQPGFSTTSYAPIIELDGNSAAAGSSCLVINAAASVVRGLVINRWPNHGIRTSSDNLLIQGNYIGTDAAGSAARGSYIGIFVSEGSNNTIGGSTAGARNVISGNAYGVDFFGLPATGNVLRGNYIGTNADGTAAVPNGVGVLVTYRSSNNVIGGPATGEGNLIAGNTNAGVRLNDGAAGNVVQGNRIGLSSTGAALGNLTGVLVQGGANATANNTIGGTASGAGNVISSNIVDGITVYNASATLIQGNFIGTDPAGGIARANGRYGVNMSSGASSNTVGGVASNEGNLIQANGGGGIAIDNNASGNRVRGNSIYGNGGSNAAHIGIDLGGDGPTANDNVKSGTANAGMDHPVFTRASLVGSTLQLAGYVGAAAGQVVFAGALVDVYISDASQPAGQGKTYLGTLTADANGNFSGDIANVPTGANGVVDGSSRITGTATDASGNTSEFGANLIVGQTLSGTVFEDVNYGGGAGRSRSNSAGSVGLANVTVELYDANGAYQRSVTTNSAGAYSFVGVGNGNLFVRVASTTVASQRGGTTASLRGVMTYRTTAASGSAVDVSDWVGGTDPAAADPGVAATGATLNTSSYVFSTGLTGTAHAVAPVTTNNGSLSGVDFGFNFSTVVNANDSGPGSLRQAITNANALANDGLQQTSRTAGIEHLIFMIPNGSTAGGNTTTGGKLALNGGLRSSLNAFSGGAASLTLASLLPSVSSPMVIDAQTQPGWTLNPVVLIGGNALTGNGISLVAGASNSVISGLIVRQFTGRGIDVASGVSGVTITGNFIGRLTPSGTDAGTSLRNTSDGIFSLGNGTLIGGSTAAQRNVVAGNGAMGMVLGGTGMVVRGNYVGVDATGATALGNGNYGIDVLPNGPSATIGGTGAGEGNVVSGNGNAGVIFEVGSTGSIKGNRIGTAANGTTTISGNGAAIFIAAAGVVVGGTEAGAGNIISGSNVAGVIVAGSTTNGVQIAVNSIFGNAGAGIDLANNGITPNDGAKTNGTPNLLMDSPVFTTARATGSRLMVEGYVGTLASRSAFANARVEIFVSETGGNGSGGGKTYLGSVSTDGSGNFAGTITMPVASLPFGTRLTGTATDGSGNTSEFGVNFNALIVDLVVNSNLDDPDADTTDGQCLTAGGVCTLRAAIAQRNAWGALSATPSIVFAIPGCTTYGSAGCTITPTTALPSITQAVLVDATTQAGFNTTTYAPLIEVNGAMAPANASGLVVAAASSTVRGFSIGGFGQSGLSLSANNVSVLGNYIGLRSDGVTARPNGSDNSATAGVFVNSGTGVVIGGSTAAARNVISGNGGSGVWVSGGTVSLVGNYIGTNASGTAALGNRRWGVTLVSAGNTVGGATAGAGNVISGNSANGGGGLLIFGASQTVLGNAIGTSAARDAFIPNGANDSIYSGGIDIREGANQRIGGTNAGEGNLIAGNQGHGVRVAPQGSRIQGNAIYANARLGIDLNGDGVSANTGGFDNTAPNRGMNHPVITGAGVGSASGSDTLTVYGYIGTGTGQPVFAGSRVEIFRAAPDPSGYGEGQTYLGFLTADADGRFSGTLVLATGTLAVGDPLTATATSSGDPNTSEFGPNWTTTTVEALTPGSFNAFDTDAPATALTHVIRSRVAGTPANIAVIALNSAGTGLHPGFTGTVSLTWVDARDDSGAVTPAGGSCRASWVAQGAVGSAGSAVFNNSARVTVSVTPPATATRVMRLRMSFTDGSGTKTACSNDAFAALPASLNWLGASDADSQTAGTTRTLDTTTASGGTVHRAGRPFTVRMQALTSTGALMTGYDGTPVLNTAGCLLPSGCTAAALTAASTAAAAGLYTHNAVSYAEVGAIQLRLQDTTWANIDTADTDASVRTLTSSLLNVGRFVPDNFTVAMSTPGQLATANAACMAAGSGATFTGQGFTWQTAPEFTITARNAAGATTTFWTANLMKLLPSGLVETLTASNTGSATLSASYDTFALQDLGGGQVRATASTLDRFVLGLPAGTPQDSTTPTWAWSATVSDPSEAGTSGNPTLTGTVNQGSVSFNSGGVFHTGRLTLSPGYGDVRAGVKLLAQLQRYTAAGWVTLTEDTGCVTINPQNLGVEQPSGVFVAAGSCAAPMQASATTRGGRAWISLPPTPAGAPGRLALRLAGGGATGNSCTPAGATAALVAMDVPWLLGGPTATGPVAWATWGTPQRDALLRREVW